MSLNFQSKENQNIIKDIIINSLKKENVNGIWIPEYDKSIHETMLYVESKVSKDILMTMDEEEYLVKMNRKVFSIIQPIIGESIKNEKKSDLVGKKQMKDLGNQDLYQAYEKAKQMEIENNGGRKRVTFDNGPSKEGVHTKIRSGNERKPKIDPMFDPELMRHYENIPVMEYPKIVEETRLNNETFVGDYKSKRNEIFQEPQMNIPFQTKKIEKEEDSKELMKSYNDKMKEYENQMLSINNFDEGQKSMNRRIENNLERRRPFESVEDNLFINRYQDQEHDNLRLRATATSGMRVAIGSNFPADMHKAKSIEHFDNSENKNKDDNSHISGIQMSDQNDLSGRFENIVLPETIKTYEYDDVKENKNKPMNMYSDMFEKGSVSSIRNNILMNEKNTLEKYNNNNTLDFSPVENKLVSTMLSPKVETELKTYQIILFSFFRNKKLYPYQGDFTVKFNPSENSYVVVDYVDSHGTLIYKGKTTASEYSSSNIPITFDNIRSIKVIEVSVPTITNYIGGRSPVVYNGPIPVPGQEATGTFSQYNPIATKSTGIPMSVYKEPVIYLYIPEIQHSYYSTSDFGRKIFAKLIPDYGENSGFQTIYTSTFTNLRPATQDEFYKYNPVLRGKLDKMSLKMYNYHGNLYNFGIDKLFISNISRGEKRYGGSCGDKYYTTKILIKNDDPSYAYYCKLFNRSNNNCTTLNSHTVSPGDLIYFYSTLPLLENYIYFEDYIKVKYIDKTHAPNYLVIDAFYGVQNNELNEIIEYPIIFKDFIPGGNIGNSKIYENYSIVLFIEIPGHIGLKQYVMNILGFEPDGGVRLEYIPSINQIMNLSNIVKIAWTPNNGEGSNNDDRTSLFFNQGYNVINVGEFTDLSQLDTEDTNPFLIEIDYPFDYLPKELNPDNPNNDFSPGDIFFIQHKLQLQYSFEITCEVKDSKGLNSMIQGTGLNF